MKYWELELIKFYMKKSLNMQKLPFVSLAKTQNICLADNLAKQKKIQRRKK